MTDAEARMLGVSSDRIQIVAVELDVQKVLQNSFASVQDVRDRLARVYEVLVTGNKSPDSLSYRDWQKLAAILRRWMGERRIRSFNEGLIGRLPSLIWRATRSAAANMRLVAPIGAPPRLA
jgi:hypothetical protein